MTITERPRFTELSREESIAMLARHHVGRLAYTLHDRVDVEPISYVYAAGWLYMRTSLGHKLALLRHHPWVALEIDEVNGPYDWRSVVARGTIYFLDADRGPIDRREYGEALAILRAADPNILTSADVAPHRSHLFRIHVDDITGRSALQ